MPKLPFTTKRIKFYDLFEKAAANLLAVSKELLDLLNNYDHIQTRVNRITELEHYGDSITHQILEQLHLTFVTPLDREDISLMAYRIDDMVDCIEASANAMILYNVMGPTDYAKEISEIIVAMAEMINKVMPQLRHKKQMKLMLNECVEINRLENVADESYRQAITDLFVNQIPDPIYIIKWREIYDILESATDRGEDIANVLESIVLKYA